MFGKTVNLPELLKVALVEVVPSALTNPTTKLSGFKIFLPVFTSTFNPKESNTPPLLTAFKESFVGIESIVIFTGISILLKTSNVPDTIIIAILSDVSITKPSQLV